MDGLQQLLLVELVLLQGQFQVLAEKPQVLHLLLVAVLFLQQLLVLFLCEGGEFVQLAVDRHVFIRLLDHAVEFAPEPEYLVFGVG